MESIGELGEKTNTWLGLWVEKEEEKKKEDEEKKKEKKERKERTWV
jgi:hypothetical protein